MYTIYKENYNVDTNLDASVMLFRVMNPHQRCLQAKVTNPDNSHVSSLFFNYIENKETVDIVQF